MVDKKAFPANPKHQYHVSQYGVHDCVPLTKIMEIITSIKFDLFDGQTLIIRNMVKRKAFLTIQSTNIMYPNEGNMIIEPITKRMEIILRIQV